ncbi:MAG: hypothetical protein ACP5OK_07860 [Thermoprotei archaeon]
MLVRSVHQNCEKASSNYQLIRILYIKNTSKIHQNYATKQVLVYFVFPVHPRTSVLGFLGAQYYKRSMQQREDKSALQEQRNRLY